MLLPPKSKVVVSWSSGKDSAWMLFRLLERREFEVAGLVTTVNRRHERVAMHAVPVRLLRLQAKSLGLRLQELGIPHPCSNECYERISRQFIREAVAEGIGHMAFGDLFLEDVKRYRERLMTDTGMKPIFPLWGTPTDRLAREMLASGFRIIVTCVNPAVLPREFAGRDYDHEFLRLLPKEVDPCGERGEFHTFVYDGPIFREALKVRSGRIVEREGFVFADVVEIE